MERLLNMRVRSLFCNLYSNDLYQLMPMSLLVRQLDQVWQSEFWTEVGFCISAHQVRSYWHSVRGMHSHE